MLQRFFLSTYRLTLLTIHILSGAILLAIRVPGRPFGWIGHYPLIQWWHNRLLSILGITVTIRGDTNLDGSAVLVCNHVSWVDIPLLGGLAPLSFISKAEVKGWPLIGWMAARSGTLFMERGKVSAATAIVRSSAEVIRQGAHILFFPEGMTTDGHEVAKFYPTLFRSALEADVDVIPIAIRYLHADTGSPHETVPYFGDDVLILNLLQLVGVTDVVAEITILEPLEQAKDNNARVLSELARSHISDIVSTMDR